MNSVSVYTLVGCISPNESLLHGHESFKIQFGHEKN